MVVAQKWLDENYPFHKRDEIKELIISSYVLHEGNRDGKKLAINEYLEGPLKLEGFNNLEKLDCQINFLTEVDLSPLKNPEKLTYIDLSSNNIASRDLTCFERFTNLEVLKIGSLYEERIRQGIYNRFCGSLEPLRNLSQLEILHIEATDIEGGLEYLPNNLTRLYCFSFKENKTKSEKIRRSLEPHEGKFILWREEYFEKYQELGLELEGQIKESLVDKKITLEEQKIINRTIIFLGTKELFINYRQGSINGLIDCYNKLEKSGSKLKKFGIFSRAMGITGKLAKFIPGGEVVEAPVGIIGDIADIAGTIIEGRNLEKCTKAFQEILSRDKKNLLSFDANYHYLIKSIWPNNDKGEVASTIVNILKLSKIKMFPFSDENDVFNNRIGGIWKGRTSLELGEIKNAIEVITNKLDQFKTEFQQEKEQLSKQDWFIAVEEKTDLINQ